MMAGFFVLMRRAGCHGFCCLVAVLALTVAGCGRLEPIKQELAVAERQTREVQELIDEVRREHERLEAATADLPISRLPEGALAALETDLQQLREQHAATRTAGQDAQTAADEAEAEYQLYIDRFLTP